MKVFDFATSRRAYQLSKVLGDDYRFFLSGGRKEYLTENKRDLDDLKVFSPDTLKNRISKVSVDHIELADVVLVSSMSMLFKEFQKEAIDLINKSKNLVAIDYAWDCARRDRKKTSKALRKKFDALAIAGSDSKNSARSLPCSQPEIDMYADADIFVAEHNLLSDLDIDDSCVLVTSGYDLSEVKSAIKWLSKQNRTVVWKLKDKNSEFRKPIEKMLKANRIDYRLLLGSHTDFISRICAVSTVCDYHINIARLSFSQAEMVRAGVPTYTFSNNNLTIPGYLKDFAKNYWTKDSIIVWENEKDNNEKIRNITIEKELKAGGCSANLVKNLKNVFGERKTG